MDPFSVLGVAPTSDKAAIRKAYYDKCKEYHPDRTKTHDTASMFQQVTLAWEILQQQDHNVVLSSSSSLDEISIGDFQECSQDPDKCFARCRCGGIVLVGFDELLRTTDEEGDLKKFSCDSCSLKFHVVE
jgi:hypothetical protein